MSVWHQYSLEGGGEPLGNGKRSDGEGPSEQLVKDGGALKCKVGVVVGWYVGLLV